MIIKKKASSIEMQYTLKAMKSMAERSGLAFAAGANGKLDHIAIRKTMEAGYANYPVAAGVTFEDYNVCPVRMEVAVPEKLTDDKNIMFYIHGGGMCCGSAKLSRGIASQLAVDLGCKVFSVDYRLCPENKYPAGVDDCFTAYKALTEKFPQANIAIMGESAGAVLTITTTLHAIKAGVKVPSCIVPNSPVGVFANIERNFDSWNDTVLAKDAFGAFKNFYYTDEDDESCAYLNPLYSDFKSFPTTVITCAENETLKTDAYLIYEKMKEQGVEVTLFSYDDTFHAFGATGRGTPESSEVLDFSENKIKESFSK